MRKLLLAIASIMLLGCSSSSSSSSEKAPDLFKVNLDTSKGPIVIEVHRDWAPVGADHFYTLVKSGFYDGDRFFRVVPGFVIQFGINGDPATNAKWKGMSLVDDPVKQSNTPGTVTYAATQNPNSRTTQLFINIGNNQRLDGIGFAPFGKVTTGMEVVEKIFSGYGEKPDQSSIEAQGNGYLESQFPLLDYVKKATIQ